MPIEQNHTMLVEQTSVTHVRGMLWKENLLWNYMLTFGMFPLPKLLSLFFVRENVSILQAIGKNFFSYLWPSFSMLQHGYFVFPMFWHLILERPFHLEECPKRNGRAGFNQMDINYPLLWVPLNTLFVHTETTCYSYYFWKSMKLVFRCYYTE